MAVTESEYISRRLQATGNFNALREVIEQRSGRTLHSPERQALREAVSYVVRRHGLDRNPDTTTMNEFLRDLNRRVITIMLKYMHDLQKQKSSSSSSTSTVSLSSSTSTVSSSPSNDEVVKDDPSQRRYAPLHQSQGEVEEVSATERVEALSSFDLDQRLQALNLSRAAAVEEEKKEKDHLVVLQVDSTSIARDDDDNDDVDGSSIELPLLAANEMPMRPPTPPSFTTTVASTSSSSIDAATEAYKAPALQNHYVVIDSNARNLSEYPSESNYRVSLPTSFKEVVELELLQASVPNCIQTVTATANVIVFQESADTLLSVAPTLRATVAPGVYERADLLSAVQTAMNAVSSFSYRVTLQPNTHRITVARHAPGASDVFTLHADAPQSLATVLGFDARTYTGNTSYEADRPYEDQPHPYVLLHLENVPSRVMGSHTACTGAYLPVFFDHGTPLWSRKVYSSALDFQHVVTFVPPLESLSVLHIHWKTADNEDVPFSGQNHQLVFRIATWTGTVRNVSRIHHLETMSM